MPTLYLGRGLHHAGQRGHGIARPYTIVDVGGEAVVVLIVKETGESGPVGPNGEIGFTRNLPWSVRAGGEERDGAKGKDRTFHNGGRCSLFFDVSDFGVLALHGLMERKRQFCNG